MDGILWSAARRLCVLVVCTLALVATPLAWDPRLTAMAAAAYGIALALLAAGVVALLHARRFFLRRRGEEEQTAQRPADAYRMSALDRAGVMDDAPSQNETGGARGAAMALLFFALSGALTIVAATAAAR